MKIYISRKEAEKQYGISPTRLRELEQKGVLTAYDAEEVGYSRKTRRGGARVKVVYDDAQVASVARQIMPDVRMVKRNRVEAQAYPMLAKGADVIDLVEQLRIDGITAREIRDFYVREKGAVIVPGPAAEAIRALGFSFTQETAADTIERLVERIRKAEDQLEKLGKLPKRRAPKKKR